ncbi:hypothetical protein Dimus_033585 [Dionaea muscipula]
MDVEVVLEFLRENGFSEAELAMRLEMDEKGGEIGSFEFERFLFPMNRSLPPVKLPASSLRRRVEGSSYVGGSGGDVSEDEEFVSLDSSTSADAGYSSEFTNPYGQHSTSELHSDASSDRLSQFGTAREYSDFDMQTDLWYDDKDEGYYFSPVGGFDPFGCQSEDKFVTVAHNKSEVPRFGSQHLSEGLQSQVNFNHVKDPLQISRASPEVERYGHIDYYHLDDNIIPHDQGVNIGFNNPDPHKSFVEAKGLERCDSLDLKEAILNGFQQTSVPTSVDSNPVSEEVVKYLSLFSNAQDSPKKVVGSKTTYIAAEEDFPLHYTYDNEDGDDKEVVEGSQEINAAVDEQETAVAQELLISEGFEDEYDVFNLRIIHRLNRLVIQLTELLMTIICLVSDDEVLHCVSEFLVLDHLWFLIVSLWSRRNNFDFFCSGPYLK